MHTYLHAYLHILHAYTYIHTYIHTYVHTYIRTHVCPYTYIYMYIHIYLNLYKCLQPHTKTNLKMSNSNRPGSWTASKGPVALPTKLLFAQKGGRSEPPTQGFRV